MTRIIGGEAGGRRLRTPTGESTRPTSDRVREALFSSLEALLGSVHGLRFLDLYSGSGAVGLEARSRGAGVVTCVEQDRRTAALVRDNARNLGLEVEVVASAVARHLAHPPRTPYDVVFADPPYPLPTAAVEADLVALREHAWLTPGALVVLERSSRGTAPSWPEGYEALRERRYGETVLWYGRAASVPPSEDS
ncbi:MAG TPA: 16S rRNA (guanine(966)-N(2))-methyltransferase RsmD [Nocardioides sp.]|nr:16S rRNA (guanine(966)-N(2))-methyltransferase RsmD [Nocardioides sp.]